MAQSKCGDVFIRPDGKLYHLGVGPGDLNPRILTVGDRQRAKLLADNFLEKVQVFESARDFVTFSGIFDETPVSIVCIGMGAPNMDFLVKEASYLFEGKGLAFIRLGTCGSFNINGPVDTVFISDRLYYSYRNYLATDGDALTGAPPNKCAPPFLISGPVEGDKEIADLLEAGIKPHLRYIRGSNVSAETFYSAEGRTLAGFDDASVVFKNFEKLKVDSCEMESHQLFHLCRERNNVSKAVTKAGSVCVAVVSRVDCEKKEDDDLPDDDHAAIIIRAGYSALVALKTVAL